MSSFWGSPQYFPALTVKTHNPILKVFGYKLIFIDNQYSTRAIYILLKICYTKDVINGLRSFMKYITDKSFYHTSSLNLYNETKEVIEYKSI